jgi:hypothetical protein
VGSSRWVLMHGNTCNVFRALVQQLVSAWHAVQPPLFPSDCEFAQLLTIFQVLGTPTEETWPGVTDLKDWCATSTRCSAATWLAWVVATCGPWSLRAFAGR